jgi:hypothetical protein
MGMSNIVGRAGPYTHKCTAVVLVGWGQFYPLPGFVPIYDALVAQVMGAFV